MEQKRCSDLTPDNFIISSPAYCLPEASVVQMNITYHTRVSRMCPNSEPVRELIHVSTHRHPAPPLCPKTTPKETTCRVALQSHQISY